MTNTQDAPLKILGVRPHPHRALLGLPNELQIGWVRDGAFFPWGSVPNRDAFEVIKTEIVKKLGRDVEVLDCEANDE